MSNRIKNIHPGDILRDEFLEPMHITVYRLSKETGLSQTRIAQILKKERSITVETALKFGKFFGTEPQFWLNLQNYYDLEEANKQYKKDLDAIHDVKELGLVPV